MKHQVSGTSKARGAPTSRKRRRSSAPRSESGNTTVTGLCISGVIGLAVLGHRGPEYEVRQTTYTSHEECLRDWGTEEDCAPQGATRTSYGGPRYYWDPERNHPVIVRSDGSEHPATSARIGPTGSSTGRTSIVGSFARGGFGHIGRGFSAGRGG